MTEQASFIVRLVDKLSAPARKATGALSRLDKALSQVRKTAAFERLDTMGDSVLRGARNISLAVSVLGAAAAAFVVKRTVELGAFLERARMGLSAIGKSTSAGNAAMSSAIALAREFGFMIEDSVDGMVKLRAAGFSLGESEDLLRLGADLKALGKNAEEVKRAVNAITQIKAKGRLQSEELVGQLAEAGVNTSAVFKILATDLGKTEAQIRALMQAGEITADQGIAAIKKAVLATTGGKKLGDVGRKIAQETLGGALDRLKAAPGLFLARVTDAMGPALKRLASRINMALEDLDATDPGALAAFVTQVLDLVPAAITAVKGFAQGFGEGFKSVLEGMGAMGNTAEQQRQFWFDLGKATATFFSAALTVANALAKAFVFLTSPVGQFLTGMALGLLMIPKMITAVVLLAKGWALLASAGQGFVFVFGPLIGIIKAAAIAVATFVAGVGLLPIAIGAAVIAAGVALFVWWDDIIGFFDRNRDQWWAIGFRLVEGMALGIRDAAFKVFEVVGWLADSVKNGIKSALGIASPSKVMRELGAFAGEGFALGLEGQQQHVDQASQQTMTPGPALQHVTNNSGRRSVAITVNVAAGVGGRTQGARELGEMIAREVQKAMRGMGESPAGA